MLELVRGLGTKAFKMAREGWKLVRLREDWELETDVKNGGDGKWFENGVLFFRK